MMKDVAIIGAGPVGLFAVFEFGMLGLSSALIDGLPAVGGQCRALYAEKPIYDIPAHPSILAGELVDKLWGQAKSFTPDLHLSTSVETIDRTDEGFILGLKNGETVHARTVLIAAGAGAFMPNRPPLEDIESFEQKSVFYFVDKVDNFRGKKILIAGGGDSAVDWALILSDVADVTMVHRRAQFRAAPESLARLKEKSEIGKIKIKTPYQLHALQGQNGVLSAVHIKSETDGIETITADILLPFFGLMPSLGSIESWGLDLEQKTIKVDQSTSATNIAGVYAAGDIAGYPKKLKLILTGFAECAQAAHAIYAYLNPDKPLHFMHSTDLKPLAK
jgi:thioredoxin reductase (NADPH)